MSNTELVNKLVQLHHTDVESIFRDVFTQVNSAFIEAIDATLYKYGGIETEMYKQGFDDGELNVLSGIDD